MLLYFTCKNKRGIKMEKFWLALETELRAQRLTAGDSAVGNGEKFVISRQFPGRRIYAHYLEIYPAKGVAHNIDIDEIWIGKDNEGCVWSDNMGGRRIDFTGKTMKDAAQELVEVLFEHFPEYFMRQ